MPKFSVCIEMIFREEGVDYPERVAKAAAAGADAVEFWRWKGKDLCAIGQAASEHGVAVATFGATSERLVDASTREAFVAGVEEAIGLAGQLSCPGCLQTVGQELEGVERATQHRAIVDALSAAAPKLEESGLKLYVEPLNILVNHQGYYLSTSDEAFEILREVASPNVLLLYDIYHQQITEGNLIQTIEENIDLIGHFHVADVPGRNEPGTGELNYANIFRRIDALGYAGFVGMEFKPTVDHAEAVAHTIALGA
ncbi:MAG: TIM barrel protein [Lentisphaerae bacterium]|jgi:hydroxypyruvate isomerase|nr:TIM barrel protein [Lentisphaerota bacterium]MBT4815835.1 TIM barrel protein [Lentisphaerota bacterium]MBT5611768.1 TIM barrel protein [Lentisphaerota bacterium]MBT7057327.1 TIM barrel protein [Lentisphaerota bacterium]MBT7841845.1 TIM barrel protein [Lentisphaerota bacterium]